MGDFLSLYVHPRQSPNSVLFFYLMFMASHQLEGLGIAQLFTVVFLHSIIDFHHAVQQKFRMIDVTIGGESFVTVQSRVNLAWSSYLEFTASLVPPTASPEV